MHPKRVLILGVNGFIGHHLTRRILETTDWEVYGMDMASDRLGDLVSHPRMHFFEGDITINKEWIEYNIRKCDVVLPLVAIATPATYVRHPLRVFELDFEANLPMVRAAVKYKKHLVFPSTSEVYGMCADEEFDPEASPLVYGPINKPRWIYACSKQLMDRVIHAYGMEEGLNYTLFRPFNWIGAGLDSIFESKEGSSRVVTQFLGHIVRGEPIKLVDGGAQKRAFADISDGISALMQIIENKNGVASGKIFNIGNPANIHSVRELAEMMLKMAADYPEYAEEARKTRIVETSSGEFYGKGYQDVQHRVPKIDNTIEELGLAAEAEHGAGAAPHLRGLPRQGGGGAYAGQRRQLIRRGAPVWVDYASRDFPRARCSTLWNAPPCTPPAGPFPVFPALPLPAGFAAGAAGGHGPDRRRRPPARRGGQRQPQRTAPVRRPAAAVSSIAVDPFTAASPLVNLSELTLTVPGIAVRDRQNYAQDLQIAAARLRQPLHFRGARGAAVRRWHSRHHAGRPGQASTFDLANASRVEVLRGPFAQMYGNASGGVVQVFTPDPPKDGFTGRASTGFGSDGQWQAGVRAGRRQ